MEFVEGFIVGLAFWPIVYYLIIIAASLALFVLIESERTEFGIGIAVIAIAASTYFLTDGAPLDYVIAHPTQALMWVGGYFAVGAVWSVWKWYLYSGKRRREFDRFLSTYIDNRLHDVHAERSLRASGTRHQQSVLSGANLDEIESALKAGKVPDHYLDDWQRVSNTSVGLPRVRDSKAEVMTWIAYWPWSMLNYLLFRIIRDFFRLLWNLVEWIWQRLLLVYHAVTTWRFRDVDPRLLKK